jgi:capsular exopolysaccharide synthesis family protein
MSRYFELLRQANQGQDLFDEDGGNKLAKVAPLVQAKLKKDRLQPSGRPEVSVDHNRTLNAVSINCQSAATAEPIISRVEPAPNYHFGLDDQNRSQEGELQPHSSQSGFLTEQALTQAEESKLVQRVFLLPGPDAPRRVVFTGVGRGNGCTWICARAGITLARQVAGSVCVVDANLRSPSLHHHFDLVNNQGLSGALLHTDPLQDYVRQLAGSNLWVLTSGPLPSDPYALLATESLRLRMAEMRAMFDYVLIDAPPVNLFNEAALLGQLVDGVVLVMEANSTRREAARKAKERLEAAKSHVLAAVLNNRTFPIPDGIYRRL